MSAAELTTVLRREAKNRGLDGNRVARDALRRLRAHAAFREAPAVDGAVIAEFYEQDSRISFVDAWNIAASEAAREPLVSFDQAVLKAARPKTR